VLFGVTTMTLFHRPILEALEIIARCGYDCVEIWADHVWDDRNGASVEELKTALAVHKLKPTIHCPILGVSIASPNRGIRAELLDLVDLRVRIPLTEGVESLNAAVAASLILYEIFRQRDPNE